MADPDNPNTSTTAGFSGIFMSGEGMITTYTNPYPCGIDMVRRGHTRLMEEVKQDYWAMLFDWDRMVLYALIETAYRTIYRILICLYVIRQPKPRSRLKAKLYK